MTCVEMRPHVSHRSTMLHHRFPNGFTEIFMDETDREVSILTDRAFRSLCIGDEAIYNDEFSRGYSPFSCHKPLVGEPQKKMKDTSKKQQIGGAKNTQPCEQQKAMSGMSLLKALSVTENCEGLLNQNGDIQDNNGEAWDKSALLSIERELSEFSSDFNNLATKKSGADANCSKTNNGKLRKLNIKNFFLHSEFSPFLSWRDFNRLPFIQEKITSILPTVDNLPKWYDSPLYKELTEAHRMETMHAEEAKQQKPVKPPPPPPPPRPRLPPKVLPKPIAPEKRCASDTSSQSETIAPWRRNSARAKSALLVNKPGVVFHSTETPKIVEESHVAYKKEVKSVKVNELEEPCSSTPFSICQLMTPIIPSRQATDTSEVTSVILSPSLLDLPSLDLELVSPVKSRSTPEVVKRESYKSIASSLLFNLKDNRKRVKSRYSPPKFKTEQADQSTPKLQEQRLLKYAHAPSDGTASGFSTPAILASGFSTPGILLDGLTIKSTVDDDKYVDSDLTDDYLIAKLLHTRRDSAGFRSPGTHFTHSKLNNSHLNKKQAYPSLKLYKSPAEQEMKLLSPTINKDTLLSTTPNKGVVLNISQDNTTSSSIGHSPNMSDQTKDLPIAQKKGTSPNICETPAKMILELNEQNSGDQPTLTGNHREELPRVQNKVVSLSGNTNQLTKDKVKLKELLISEETANTSEDTIITAQNKIQFANQSNHTKKLSKDGTDLNVKDTVQEELRAGMEAISTTRNKILHNTDNILKSESPPVKDDNAIVGGDRLSFSVPKSSRRQTEQQTTVELSPTEKLLTNGFVESAAKEKESVVVEDEQVKRQGRFKHIFSARQNNYIKSQRCAMIEHCDKREDKEEFEPVMVNNKKDIGKVGLMEITDRKNSEQIISDLHALKELEKARMNERLIKGGENLKQKPVMDEEAKAKNNLISRELRNIKRGILSMRANTFAKKEIFPNTEKEQSNYDTFLKIDNNVVINKSLINDNYDKAKMALEEIISDRAEKLKSKVYKNKEGDNNTVADKNMERRDLSESAEEKQKNVRERLGDLRDHQLIQEILSQTETKLCVNHRLGAKMYAEQNKLEPICIMEVQEQGNTSNVSDKNLCITESSKQSAEEIDTNIARVLSAEKREGVPRNDELVTEKSQLAAPIIKPEVPPRGKKGSTKKEDGTENEKGCLNLFAASDEDTKNRECLSRGSKYDNILPEEARGEISNRQDLDAKIKPDRQTDALATDNTSDHNKCMVNADEELVQVNTEKMSPLSNNSGVNPSQQDQNSMSSKSSYFSVESSFHRNVETDSNIYQSLENLIAELEEVEEDVGDVLERLRVDSEKRTELEYYSVSDHENEDIEDKPIVPPRRDKAISMSDDREPRAKDTDQRGWVQSPVDNTSNQTATSQSNVFSSSLGKPSLFKVKDNTFSHHVSPVTKTVKPVLHKTNHDPVQSAPWSPSGSMCGSKRSEDDHIDNLSAETVLPSDITITPEKQVKPTNISTHSAHSTLSPSELNLKHSQNHDWASWSPRETITGSEKVAHSEPHDAVLTPDEPKETASHLAPHCPMSPTKQTQENSPKDQQYDSFLTVPQADYQPPGVSPYSEGNTVDATYATPEGSKVPSERSGSVCSGNDSQGLGRPPVVPPKSEKALLKAMKLTTRRIRKEEEKSKPQKSSGSSKSRSGRRDPNNDKSSEQKSRSERSDKQSSSEKQHQERKEDSSDSSDKRGKSSDKHGHGEMAHHVSIRDKQNCGNAERQGRRTEQHSRQKPEKRFFSSDRAPSERQTRIRAQSMDRHIGDKGEIRISSCEAPSGDRPEPRSQRIEKSIRNGLSQRGRAQERSIRDKPDNRNQSVDSYASDIDLTSPHPNLSRQSSYTSQFSHQSSIDHGYTSFPMTQRKLLQDPDSGQYFVFDMPVQVKTKTFFDPETGNYVQLPIQPSEDPMTQVSTMEVMNSPRVIYHGSFVPVPVSTISSQNSVVFASQLEKEQFEQKPEKQWYNHNNEGPPYLEPVYGSQDHMLGEFIATEDRYDGVS